MKFEESIVINAPVEQVFSVWTDVEKYHEWAKPVIERKKLTEGPVNIGTKFFARDRFPGKTMEFEMEITEYEPNKRFGARWSKPMEGAWTSSLTERASGTRLDFQIEMKPPVVMRLLSVFLKGWIRKENARFMRTLKERVEKMN